MHKPSTPIPSAADAAQLVEAMLHRPATQITRFGTGSCHDVYAVRTTDQREVVVRFAASGVATLNGAVYWFERLRPLGIPLPALIGDDREATLTPFPALVLERLPGVDLWQVYPQLTQAQKHVLAHEIVQIQQRVATLPHGPGYGFATGYDDPGLLPSWEAVVKQSLARSHRRITQIGAIGNEQVARVRNLLGRFTGYFAGIPPQPFLDDTTTKNVLIHNGALSGIVDVDYVCFGDPLFTVALTQMALLGAQMDLEYTEAWCNLLALTNQQRTVVEFYTCVFCVDFMSEVGWIANQNSSEQIDWDYLRHLEAVLDGLIERLSNAPMS